MNNTRTNQTLIRRSDDPADDAIWILTSTFIIFTMQSGFGLLESGSVSKKNELNIMVKNAADVIFGGLTYWAFGYAFSFGDEDHKFNNPFSGWGYFFVSVDGEKMGEVYSKFFFQASFATTATTIVSGAMAERCKLESYILFSFLNTLVYCFPSHWLWGNTGWLRNLGSVDIAGAGPVHLVGGVTGLVATLMLRPRYERFKYKRPPVMASPTNAVLGMFMLWWGWLGFNCGSTFGISGGKWKLAARSAVTTFTASIAGGAVACVASYVVKKKQFDVTYLINGILGALVSVTAHCALAQPWEGIVSGLVGGVVALAGVELLEKLHVDDPVGAVGVHAVGAVWSLLAVGFFAREDDLRVTLGIVHNHYGLFYGGSAYLLGIQTLTVVALILWTVVISYALLKVTDLLIGMRVTVQHEVLGADIIEHNVGHLEYIKKTNSIHHEGKTLKLDDVDPRVLAKQVEEMLQTHSSRSRLYFFQENENHTIPHKPNIQLHKSLNVHNKDRIMNETILDMTSSHRKSKRRNLVGKVKRFVGLHKETGRFSNKLNDLGKSESFKYRNEAYDTIDHHYSGGPTCSCDTGHVQVPETYHEKDTGVYATIAYI